MAALAQLDGDLAAEARLLLEERARYRAGTVLELPSHLGVTAAAALSQQPDAFAVKARRPLPSEPNNQALLGQIFHARVEAWLRSSPEQAAFDLAELDVASDNQLGRRVDALMATFTNSQWASPGGDLKLVDLERSLAVTVGGVTLRGRVDAIFEDSTGQLVLVDWKTGGLDRATGQPKPEHVGQLQLYRAMLSKLRNVPTTQIKAAIYYVKDDHTAWLEPAGADDPLSRIEAATSSFAL
jgi:DNA helicase-2/ATP-dependent DNA helicase PcrA